MLRKVRLIALERRTSLNALVRQHLEALARQDDEREAKRRAALAELKAMSAKSDIKLGADYNSPARMPMKAGFVDTKYTHLRSGRS